MNLQAKKRGKRKHFTELTACRTSRPAVWRYGGKRLFAALVFWLARLQLEAATCPQEARLHVAILDFPGEASENPLGTSTYTGVSTYVGWLDLFSGLRGCVHTGLDPHLTQSPFSCIAPVCLGQPGVFNCACSFMTSCYYLWNYLMYSEADFGDAVSSNLLPEQL